MKKILSFFIYFLILSFILFLTLFTPLDKTPTSELPIYPRIMERIDSVFSNGRKVEKNTFKVGAAKISITPQKTISLAGYMGILRKSEGINDSVFVRTMVVDNEYERVVIIALDLLIIHPYLAQKIQKRLSKKGWRNEQIYFSATHTHSSIGQWAPDFIGQLAVGRYSLETTSTIINSVIKAVEISTQNQITSQYAFSQNTAPNLIHNRVKAEGNVNPYLKMLNFKTSHGILLHAIFGAHATCLSGDVNLISGDYPSYFHQQLKQNTEILFSMFSAGSTGSMGNPEFGKKNIDVAKILGKKLAEKIIIPINYEDSISITLRRIKLPLPKPQIKIFHSPTTIVVRPSITSLLLENDYKYISLLSINRTLLIGLPCDFSGEIAESLTRYAKNQNIHLIITSFNGGYMGYVSDDQNYFLNTTETKDMNWYGVGMGAYHEQIIKKIVDTYSQVND